MDYNKSEGYKKIKAWLKADGKKPFEFQESAWQNYLNGFSGLVNAPTGFGKTFSLFLAVVIEGLNEPIAQKSKKKNIIYD